MNAQPLDEFCPRCGVWVSVLDEPTGWCEPCAQRYGVSYETAQKRAWRAANRERERAYQAQRPRGRCPECLQVTWLTQGGVLTNHLYRMRRVYSGERCAGSGQPPTTHNPHVRVDPEPSEASTT